MRFKFDFLLWLCFVSGVVLVAFFSSAGVYAQKDGSKKCEGNIGSRKFLRDQPSLVLAGLKGIDKEWQIFMRDSDGEYLSDIKIPIANWARVFLTSAKDVYLFYSPRWGVYNARHLQLPLDGGKKLKSEDIVVKKPSINVIYTQISTGSKLSFFDQNCNLLFGNESGSHYECIKNAFYDVGTNTSKVYDKDTRISNVIYCNEFSDSQARLTVKNGSKQMCFDTNGNYLQVQMWNKAWDLTKKTCQSILAKPTKLPTKAPTTTQTTISTADATSTSVHGSAQSSSSLGTDERASTAANASNKTSESPDDRIDLSTTLMTKTSSSRGFHIAGLLLGIALMIISVVVAFAIVRGWIPGMHSKRPRGRKLKPSRDPIFDKSFK